MREFETKHATTIIDHPGAPKAADPAEQTLRVVYKITPAFRLTRAIQRYITDGDDSAKFLRQRNQEADSKNIGIYAYTKRNASEPERLQSEFEARLKLCVEALSAGRRDIFAGDQAD